MMSVRSVLLLGFVVGFGNSDAEPNTREVTHDSGHGTAACAHSGDGLL